MAGRRSGFLFRPGARKGLSPGQMEALPFFNALVRDLRRQNVERSPEPVTVLDRTDRAAVGS